MYNAFLTMRGPSFSLGALWDFSGVSNAGSGGKEDVKTSLFGRSSRETRVDPFIVDILAIRLENGKRVSMRKGSVLLMPIRKQDRRIGTLRWKALLYYSFPRLCESMLMSIDVTFSEG